MKVICYDNGGISADRYTVIFLDERRRAFTDPRRYFYEALAMNEEPYHPQGIGMHCEAMRGRHLGKVIKLDSLPADCQRLVRSQRPAGTVHN